MAPPKVFGGSVSSIVALAGSPSHTSHAVVLTEHLARRLRDHGHTVRVVRILDLPSEALITADTADSAVADVLAAIADADGVLVSSGVYKAAYSGVLKLLLDLLPQFALSGKVVLPILVGGSPAHVLALDYALRPVLSAMGAHHVVPGWFVLDKHLDRASGELRLDGEAAQSLWNVVDTFSSAIPQFGTLAR